jgi:hypothetical protein
VLGLPDAQQQVELLLEQLVVVAQAEPEQREGLGERPAPDDEVDASLRDEVQRRELLEHPHGVGRAQHRDRAAQADPFGPRCGRREDHGRRRVVVLAAVVLTDAEGVEAHPVGERDLLEQVLHPLRRADHPPRRGVGDRRDEAVHAEMHGRQSNRRERAAPRCGVDHARLPLKVCRRPADGVL